MKKYMQSSKRISSKLFLLLVLLFLTSEIGFSQASLKTASAKFVLDTSSLGNTDTLITTVTNIGTSLFSGYTTTDYSSDTLYSWGGFCNTYSVTIAPQASIITKCPVVFDSTHFHQGYNIVVVWSSGNGIFIANPIKTNIDDMTGIDSIKTSADTIKIKVLLLNPQPQAGVHDINLSSSFLVYPTLTKDFINVELRADVVDNTVLPESIMITDVFGQKVYGMESTHIGKNKIQINVSKLSSGFYFLEISLPSNRKMIAKFIRTN